MGAITDAVKRYVPSSYRAMVGTTNSYYSITDLQALADFVQYRLFTTVVGATVEATSYNIEQRELLGMLTTLQFIPAAVDYWGDQLNSEATTGTNEVISYFDRRDQLWKLFAQIKADADALAADLGINITGARAVVPKVSYGDNGRNILVTPDPARFPRQGRHRSFVGQWPWDFQDPGV